MSSSVTLLKRNWCGWRAWWSVACRRIRCRCLSIFRRCWHSTGCMLRTTTRRCRCWNWAIPGRSWHKYRTVSRRWRCRYRAASWRRWCMYRAASRAVPRRCQNRNNLISRRWPTSRSRKNNSSVGIEVISPVELQAMDLDNVRVVSVQDITQEQVLRLVLVISLVEEQVSIQELVQDNVQMEMRELKLHNNQVAPSIRALDNILVRADQEQQPVSVNTL
nr:uncharacterized protein LOC115258724 [Aedes albopictus]